MKYLKILTAGTLACGLIAAAIGCAFYVSSRIIPSRPVKTADDYIQQAQLQIENGSYYKAVVSYEAALELSADDLTALSGMADAYSRMGNRTREQAVRNQIAEQAPEDLDNQVRLIEIMIQNRQLEEARAKTEELMVTNDSPLLESLHNEMEIPAPEFTLASGSYDQYQLLQLTSVYTNATVHYTVDGTEPTATSPTYTDGIVISYPSTTFRAKAIGLLGYESSETRLDFTITKPAEEIHNPSQSIRSLAYLFDKDWNSPVYNYELAQLRSIYFVSNTLSESPLNYATFYADHYAQSNSAIYTLGDLDLDFVAYTPFLKTLSIGYQESLDLTPLAGLSYLEELSLLHDGITNIQPLASLTNLKKLALGWNSISDISPLTGLTGLQSLGLWNNNIRDVSSLCGLTGLTYFDIANNQVTNIDCVSAMPALTEVWINGNQISDLSPLDNCQKLAVLMQAGNPVSQYGTVQQRRDSFYKTDVEG